MKVFQIDWYPKHCGDCEKSNSYVLANTKSDAWKIADAKYKGVDVVAVYAYSEIAGGREGEVSWCDWKIENGKIEEIKRY